MSSKIICNGEKFKTDAKSISGQRYPALMKKYMTEFLYVEVVIMVDGAVAVAMVPELKTSWI